MYTSDKDKLFVSRLDDAAELCFKRHKNVFSSFLSEREQLMAQKHLKQIGFGSFFFYGGYPEAERKILCFSFDGTESEYPVFPLEFTYKPRYTLTHRDFLGVMMSLGLERDTVGDILVGEGRTVVFVKSEIKSYITSQISKIGNVGVTVSECESDKLPKGRGTEEKLLTVSSLRLDNFVAAVTGLSREKTKSLILSGKVSHNFEDVSNISRKISEEDTITIRGKGKFIINGVVGETKKHRIKISVVHFR